MAQIRGKLNGCMKWVREKTHSPSGYFSHTFTGCNKLEGEEELLQRAKGINLAQINVSNSSIPLAINGVMHISRVINAEGVPYLVEN